MPRAAAESPMASLLLRKVRVDGSHEGADRHKGVNTMRKYVFAWLLGVPVSVLVIIYVVSHAACGR